MDIGYVLVRMKALREELTTLTSYLSPADKSRMVSIINEVGKEIRTRAEGLSQFESRSSRLTSAILALPPRPDTKDLNKFYNRYSDFSIIVGWHILRELGRDISDDPWVLKEEEKEPEEGEREVTAGQIPEVLEGLK